MTLQKNVLTRFSAILAAICFALLPGVASATILTFDQGTVSNFEAVDSTYGDDVEATLEGTSEFGYGVGAEGFTPNVQLSYGVATPALWTTQYGDLTNILYHSANGVLTVTFTADPGFLVQLYEFDAAVWPSPTSDQTINAVRVSDGINTLFEELSATISGATSTLFDFTGGAPLTAPQLILTIDALNLGAASDNIGIDNVRFGQIAIPEPSTLAIAALGLLGIGCRRRKQT